MPYVVENDGLTVLLPQEEKPVIPHGKLRQARGLRRLYNQGVRRLSMENFLWNDLNFPFVVLNGGDGGNGTHKHVGVPIGPDTAIFKIARQATVHTFDRLIADLLDADDLRRGSAKAKEKHGQDRDSTLILHLSELTTQGLAVQG